MAGTDLVPVTRVIRGEHQHIQTVLRTAHSRARLVTEPERIRPVALPEGLFEVTVEMLVPVKMLGWRKRAARWSDRHEILSACLKALAFGFAVTLVFGGALLAIVLFIIHTVDARMIGGALVLLLLAAGVGRLASDRGHSGHDGWGFHWSKCK